MLGSLVDRAIDTTDFASELEKEGAVSSGFWCFFPVFAPEKRRFWKARMCINHSERRSCSDAGLKFCLTAYTQK
jgi:hypothetical protein